MFSNNVLEDSAKKDEDLLEEVNQMELFRKLLQYQENIDDQTMTRDQFKYMSSIINNTLASVANVNKLVHHVADKTLQKR